jgi:putative intracellular protease/amidase
VKIAVAGGRFVDEPVVVGGNAITLRAPIYLSALLAAVTTALTK